MGYVLCVTIATSTSLSEWCINVNVVLQTTVRSHPHNPSIRSFVRSYAHCSFKSSGSSKHIQILRISVVHGEPFVRAFGQQNTLMPDHVVHSV